MRIVLPCPALRWSKAPSLGFIHEASLWLPSAGHEFECLSVLCVWCFGFVLFCIFESSLFCIFESLQGKSYRRKRTVLLIRTDPRILTSLKNTAGPSAWFFAKTRSKTA